MSDQDTKTTGPRGAAPNWSPGSEFGRYKAIGELGEGAMGVVLRARDRKLEREVALKLLRTDSMPGEAMQRMVREARAMARISHPNVVAVYDVELDLAEAPVALAMELVDGPTLRDWLRSNDPTPREIVHAFIAAGRGLEAAHDGGMLHRDFKPGNVLVGEQIKVTDFGLARATGDAVPNDDIPTSGELAGLDGTRTGLVKGTPLYMPPEQHAGGVLTPAADQYAFCVALWAALTGAPPFEGPRMVCSKAAGPPPWPARDPDLEGVGAALRRGLSPSPTDRWPSMGALLAVLESAWAPRPANRARVALAVGLVAACGGVGTWAALRGDAGTEPSEPSEVGLVVALDFDDERDPFSATTGFQEARCAWCPQWRADGLRGGAMAFDGEKQHLVLPDNRALRTPDGFTAAIWVRLRSRDSWQRTAFFTKPLRRAGGVGNSWALAAEQDGRLFFYSSNEGGSDFIRGSQIALDTWTHVAGTWDGVTKRLFVDGELQADAEVGIAFGDDPVILGGDVDEGEFVYGVDGLIDEARVWSHALSAAEVAFLAQRPRR